MLRPRYAAHVTQRSSAHETAAAIIGTQCSTTDARQDKPGKVDHGIVVRKEARMSVNIHPSVDSGLKPGNSNFAGGTLSCRCTTQPVTVAIRSGIAHNHACGCTKCWKPAGANFSIVAVVPSDKVAVTANADKLKVVDPSALIALEVGKPLVVEEVDLMHVGTSIRTVVEF
jgi:hypothetical protein